MLTEAVLLQDKELDLSHKHNSDLAPLSKSMPFPEPVIRRL